MMERMEGLDPAPRELNSREIDVRAVAARTICCSLLRWPRSISVQQLQGFQGLEVFLEKQTVPSEVNEGIPASPASGSIHNPGYAPFGGGTCRGGFQWCPGNAEEPSLQEMAPSGAIPYGHIPFPSLNQGISACWSSVRVFPTESRTFCPISSQPEPGLSQGRENFPSGEAHVASPFSSLSNPGISCSSHPPCPKVPGRAPLARAGC